MASEPPPRWPDRGDAGERWVLAWVVLAALLWLLVGVVVGATVW